MRKVYVEVGDGIVLVDRGAWALAADDYSNGDLVQNTGSYVCTVPHAPSSITEPGVGANWETVWKVLAVGTPGAQGIPGGVMAWKGAYSSGTTYIINDAVFANGSGYYSLQNGNLNHTPPAGTSDAYWSIFALAGSFNNEIIVGPDAFCDYVTDGTADDVQINAALDAAAASSSRRVVRILPGIYDITAQLTVHAYTSMLGSRWPTSGYNNDLSMDNFTTFDITYSANEAIRVEESAEIGNIAFWYSAQTVNGDAIGDFIQYPATIIGYGSHPDEIHIHDCNFMNSWKMMSFETYHIDLVIENVTGFPLYRGIVIDQGTSPDILRNVRFGFEYYPVTQNSATEHLQSYVRRNAIAFAFKRADHVMLSQCYVFDYDYGYWFDSATASGQFHMNECSADYCRTACVYIDNWKHGMISDCMLNAGTNTTSGLDALNASAKGVWIESNTGAGTTEDIVISNCVILSDGVGVSVKDSKTVSVANCNVLEYNRTNGGTTVWGIFLSNSDQCRVIGNMMDGKHYVAAAHSGGIGVDGNCDSTICIGNFIYNCVDATIYFDDDQGQCFGNLCAPAGCGTITVNGGSSSNGDNKRIV